MIVCLLLGNFQQSFVLQKPLVVCRNSDVTNVHCHAVSVLIVTKENGSSHTGLRY